jgi:hypothetical protein
LGEEETQRRLAFIELLSRTVPSADPVKQELVMRAAMRPEIGRRRRSDQWLGGPIAAIIDMAGDYASVVLLGRHCRRSASGSIICVRRSTSR